MATPNLRDSSSSAYALALAYGLVVLSLWNVHMGLVGRPWLAPPPTSNNTVGTSFTPTKAADESRSQVYRLLTSVVEPSAVNSSVAAGTEAENEEARRLTALSLIVYVTGDGIRRYPIN